MKLPSKPGPSSAEFRRWSSESVSFRAGPGPPGSWKQRRVPELVTFKFEAGPKSISKLTQ
eukprot:746660-Hanusia_phi.AAC.3